MEISRDELNNVSQPILADRSDDIDRNLTLNVLTVARVGFTSGLDASTISVLRVDDRHIFFSFICGLNVVFANDIKLTSSLTHILVLNDTDVSVDVESLSAGSVISSNLVAYRKVVFLRGARGSQSTAEGINDRRETTDCLSGLLEALFHERSRVTSEEGELLLSELWVISSSEKDRCDLTFVGRLLIATGRRIVHGGRESRLLSTRSSHAGL